MDSQEDVQDDVCRICRSVNSANLVGIFDDRERVTWEGRLEPMLADMLNECADCQIKPMDALPQKICRACIVAARQSFRFKRMCEQSYQFFKQRLKVGNLKDLDLALSMLLDPLTGVKVEPEDEKAKVAIESNEVIQQNEEDKEMETLLMESTEEKDEGVEPINKATKLSVQHQSKGLAEKRFETRPRRSKSASAVQQVAKDMFQCPHCSKAFEQRSYLNKHLKRHTDDKSNICPTCGKSFLFKTHLVTHLRVHTGERPFKCQDCPLTFTLKHHLKDHQKIHTSIKPFQCPHCPRTFTQRTNLKMHINLHTDKGPFECPDCSKTFSMKCALTKHLPVHSGEKPFQCPYCSKAYTKSHSLNRHVRDHTGDLYRCNSCSHVFKELYKLRQHSKNIHGINVDDTKEKKLQPKVAVARIKPIK